LHSFPTRRSSDLHGFIPNIHTEKWNKTMSYELSAEQRADILALDADERFDYFVTMVRETGEMWSLADQDEWLVLRADDEEFLPLWPHPDLATDWAGEQETAKPKAIPLAVWLERWAPGMEADGLMVAVCPGDDPNGVVVTAADLRTALQD